MAPTIGAIASIDMIIIVSTVKGLNVTSSPQHSSWRAVSPLETQYDDSLSYYCDQILDLCVSCNFEHRSHDCLRISAASIRIYTFSLPARDEWGERREERNLKIGLLPHYGRKRERRRERLYIGGRFFNGSRGPDSRRCEVSRWLILPCAGRRGFVAGNRDWC